MIFTIKKEPKGNIYQQLFNVSLNYCDKFLLVKEKLYMYGKHTELVFESLQPFIVYSKEANIWPGTQAFWDENIAVINVYKLNFQTVSLILKFTESLYQWGKPDLPDDLCLLRSDETPWLVSISHERDGYLDLTLDEKDNIELLIPGIQLELD